MEEEQNTFNFKEFEAEAIKQLQSWPSHGRHGWSISPLDKTFNLHILGWVKSHAFRRELQYIHQTSTQNYYIVLNL